MTDKLLAYHFNTDRRAIHHDPACPWTCPRCDSPSSPVLSSWSMWPDTRERSSGGLDWHQRGCSGQDSWGLEWPEQSSSAQTAQRWQKSLCHHYKQGLGLVCIGKILSQSNFNRRLWTTWHPMHLQIDLKSKTSNYFSQDNIEVKLESSWRSMSWRRRAKQLQHL